MPSSKPTALQKSWEYIEEMTPLWVAEVRSRFLVSVFRGIVPFLSSQSTKLQKKRKKKNVDLFLFLLTFGWSSRISNPVQLYAQYKNGFRKVKSNIRFFCLFVFFPHCFAGFASLMFIWFLQDLCKLCDFTSFYPLYKIYKLIFGCSIWSHLERLLERPTGFGNETGNVALGEFVPGKEVFIFAYLHKVKARLNSLCLFIFLYRSSSFYNKNFECWSLVQEDWVVR